MTYEIVDYEDCGGVVEEENDNDCDMEEIDLGESIEMLYESEAKLKLALERVQKAIQSLLKMM